MSKIAAVEVIPVAAPDQAHNDLDGTVDTVIVRLTDEAGRTGIGETDAPPAVVKSFLEMPTAHLWSRNAGEILLGADPVETAALWQKLYEGTFWPGRRGLGIHALSAIDIALYDLAGKALGLPAYKLLGGARRERLRPYCTIYPGLAQGRPVAALMAEIGRQFEAALATGFRAVKMEVLFYDLVSDAELVGLIKEGRRMLGEGILMALDFGYAGRAGTTPNGCSTASPTATSTSPRRRFSMTISWATPSSRRRARSGSAAPRLRPPASKFANGWSAAVFPSSSPISGAAAG